MVNIAGPVLTATCLVIIFSKRLFMFYKEKRRLAQVHVNVPNISNNNNNNGPQVVLNNVARNPPLLSAEQVLVMSVFVMAFKLIGDLVKTYASNMELLVSFIMMLPYISTSVVVPCTIFVGNKRARRKLISDIILTFKLILPK